MARLLSVLMSGTYKITMSLMTSAGVSEAELHPSILQLESVGYVTLRNFTFSRNQMGLS